MIPASICIISKNEEKHMEECLKRLSSLGFEIVVTDTGSTDSTLQIAAKYTDKIFHYAWNDDFSAARNFCTAQATHDAILVVDCDEYLQKDASDINGFIDEMAYYHEKNPEAIGMFTRINPYPSQGEDSVMTEKTGRFFFRTHCHYEGIIHEQVAPISGNPPVYYSIPLTFFHAGYQDPELRREKARRNLILLMQDLSVHGEDPYTCFQIGQCHTALGQTEEACHYYGLGLSFDVDPEAEYVQSMVVAYGYCLLEQKQFSQALQLESIYDTFSVQADFVFLMGLIYMNNRLFDQAITEFIKATTISRHAVLGVNSFRAWYNAGVIYECTNRISQALECYQNCGDYAKALERIHALSQ